MNAPPHIQPAAGLWSGRRLTFDTLPSTNRWALEHAAACQHGDVIRANRQTAGRGRFNREWFSPGGAELTFSLIVLGRHCQPGTATLLGLATALGIRSALAAASVPAAVKWPNDVMAADAKIAGILIEHDLRADAYIIGIGLNLNIPQAALMAMHLRTLATSMSAITGHPHDPETELHALLAALDPTLSAAMAGARADLAAAWTAHDYLRDRQVRVATPDATLAGAYAGITAEGALRLRASDGREHILFSGDASLLDPQDDG